MNESYVSKTAIHQVTVLALLITLASCGGSSGGSTAAPPPPPVNMSMLPITADNAQEITASVLEAVTSSADLVDIADVIGLPVVGSANQGFTKPALRDVITQVTACDTGDMTTTWNDVDNNLQVSTGDTFDTQFAMCFFQDSGVTINGTSTVQNVVVTGDPANQVVPWGLVATFGFIDLTATDAIDTVTINGDLDLEMSSDDNVVVNASVGSALLEVDVDGVSESLSDYLMTQLINQNLLLQDVSADGVYTSDILQGSVTFETLEVFRALGDDNPSSGELLISDTSSSVLVTVLDNLNVELGVDLDLDGTIDQTIVVTWADLDIG
jgi:hypothetical protein